MHSTTPDDTETPPMDARSLLATPDAVREFLDARRGMFRAIDADHDNGVPATRIADTVAPALDHARVLDYLAAKQLGTDARTALRAARWDGFVDIAVAAQDGRGTRVASVTLAWGIEEFTDDEAQALPDRLRQALNTAGIQLEAGEDASTIEAFWDGEPIPLRRR